MYIKELMKYNKRNINCFTSIQLSLLFNFLKYVVVKNKKEYEIENILTIVILLNINML